jgi:hypothetical protein
MSIDSFNRRLDKLAALRPAETPGRVIRLIAQAGEETQDEAIARWHAENPNEPPLGEDDFIILRSIVSPNANAE